MLCVLILNSPRLSLTPQAKVHTFMHDKAPGIFSSMREKVLKWMQDERMSRTRYCL